MVGRCGRCGNFVGAAEEKLALGKSWHIECFTCAICNRGLDSFTLAEHRELNEIYCKSCYRLYIGPEGYGYGPNGPSLIVYDMEVQDPPPGAGGKWKRPPTRLGKTFLRPKTMPEIRASSKSALPSRQASKSMSNTIRSNKSQSRADSPIVMAPPTPPPPPPPLPLPISSKKSKSSNSSPSSAKSRSQSSNVSYASKKSGIPPPPPPPPPSKHPSNSRKSGMPSSPPPPPPPPPPTTSNSKFFSQNIISSGGGLTTSFSVPVPPPPPPPPPPPLPPIPSFPQKSRSGQLSLKKSGSRSPRSSSIASKKSGSKSRSSSKTKLSQSEPTSENPDETDCPPLFYCGGACVDTPSYPRYPPGSPSNRRMPLGPNYGAVRNVPKGLGEPCRRCGRPVFLAELQLGYHGAYHTECFKCCGCGKKLDSTTVSEHQGEIFCTGCYRRNFATAGVGFGIGAGTLQTP